MKNRQKGEFLSSRVQYISLSRIRPNPQQPRRSFDEEGLQELAASIRTFGILQPLTVRKLGGDYQLIAGERRLRAARIAGIGQVPCLIAEVGEEDAGLLALIENLQRRDLDCFEEADAIAKLICRYGLSQEQAAEKLGKSQSAIANKLRLLRLSETVRQTIREQGLTERHARALLRLTDEEEQRAALETITAKKWNVAQAEEYIERRLGEVQTQPARRQATYVIKDVRLFLNSVERGLKIMRTAGVDAAAERSDTDDTIVLTIRIPRKKSRVVTEL